MTDQPEKLDLTSHNLPTDKTAELLRLFPEIRTEGPAGWQIDFDKLKLALGQTVDVGRERYGMNWPGKAECFKTIQTPSMGTLLPVPAESVDFDTTENLIIEGDNLEALKLLQKAYLGKVKMIYIDPPYNTGKDFIYPDNYTESLQTYLEYTKQVDDEGKKFGTNSDTDGRFHSRWMNMMYPRLYMARNLLKDDGVIFISINDVEVNNLRAILNDIFGEENFVASLVWDKGHSAQAGIFKVYHEYILAYARDIQQVGVPTSENNELFEAGAMKRESSRHPMQEFDFPAGVRIDAVDGTSFSGTWGGIEEIELIKGDFVVENGKTKFPMTLRAAFTQRNQMHEFFYGDRETLVDSRGQKIVDFYFNSSGKIKIIKARGVFTPETTLTEYGTQSNASTELAELFQTSETPVDNPKPVKMLSDFIRWFTDENDVIIDFFAGSGTTAQSTLELNHEITGSSRKFILIQLPEECKESSIAYRSGYRTIAEITKERVRRVVKNLHDELPISGKKDHGFRVFKLAESNFKAWDASAPKDKSALEKQLELHIEHIREGRTSEDMLYEILLKSGFPLTTSVEKIDVAGKPAYSVAGGGMLICLEKELTLEAVRAMAEMKPQRVVCLDLGFAGNDQLKTNAVQIFKNKEIVFKTV